MAAIRLKARPSGRFKSVDGNAVLAFDLSAEFSALQCPVGKAR
jgi:hypothetical protein